MTTYQKYLQVAVLAAKKSGPVFKKYFGRPVRIKMKAGDKRNLVTQADLEIEKTIKKTILKYFPTHRVLGEELGWVKNQKNELMWIIDPIDGTTNFIQGVPLACISIALWNKKVPLVSVVYNPLTNDLYSAARGKGSFLNNKKIKISRTKNLEQAFGAIGWVKSFSSAGRLFAKAIKLSRKIRALGTSTLQICYVAQGVLDFYAVIDIHFWDFASAALILQEAGGKITSLSGKIISPQTNNILASNGSLHRELLKKIK